MAVFEYLGVLVSVVIGLAVTYLINGIVDLIQRRRATKIYWVHLAWVLYILTWLIQYWWWFFAWSEAAWSLELFMFFLTYAIVLSVASGLLFEQGSQTADFQDLFFQNAGWFFGLLVLANGLDLIEVTLKARAGIRPIPASYWPLLAVMVVGLVVATRSRNARYHGAFAVFAVLSLLAYGVGVF